MHTFPLGVSLKEPFYDYTIIIRFNPGTAPNSKSKAVLACYLIYRPIL